MKAGEYIDEVLSELEDTVKGELGDRITIARSKLHDLQSQLQQEKEDIEKKVRLALHENGIKDKVLEKDIDRIFQNKNNDNSDIHN